MKKTGIITINVLIMVAIVAFVSVYSVFNDRNARQRQTEHFVNTTVAMERVTENYLEGEQRVCDVWARYINIRDMTMEEAAEFIRASHVLPNASAHLVYLDSKKGLSTRSRLDADDYEVSYRNIELLDDVSWISETGKSVNVSRAYTNPMNGEQSLAFCNMITLRDPGDGTVKDAVLLRVMPLSELEQKWIFPQEEFENAEITIVDFDGDYIIKSKTFKNSNFFEFYKSYNSSDPALLENLHAKITSSTGSLGILNSRGENMLLAYTPIAESVEWTLLSLIPETDLKLNTQNWSLIGAISLGLIVLFLIDLLFIQRFNQKLRVAAQEADSANRAKTDFLSTMSHDIRTPMNAISGIRHLENLDKTVSGVASDNTELRYVSGVDLVLSAAQTTDISWDGFTDGRIFGTGLTGEVTAVNGTYFPVTPEYRIDYNGNGLSVSGLPIVETGLPAGMFGILQNSSVKNLVLEDISAEGKNAGALAGATENTNILNVLAKNASPAASITGTECAGGLIGKVVDGGVSYSAASIIVSGAAEAGGLIGKIDGASVTGCYSAGHTADGEYNVSAGYNVASANGSAGGLAGSCKDAVISCSYSTCSAEGQVAGGLVGAASGSTAVNNSYCTGAVGGPVKGAVAGSAEDPAAFTECSYFKIINEFPDSNNAKAVVYLGEFGDGSDSAGVSAFDENLASFKEFTAVKPGVRISALPYDSTLNLYDRGIYPMPGIEALSNNTAVTDNGYCVSSHCGDWPLPDIFAVNHPAA